MDEQGFGVYKFYFKILRNFGAFPYRIEYPGTKLGYHRSGIFKWIYYLNFIAVTFGISFQFAQLLLTITYAPLPLNVITQLCWMWAMCIPLANMFAFIRREDRVVNAVDNWCHLEQSIIGSSLRGVASMPKGPLPSMSACHMKQNRLFRKTSTLYLLMGIITFVAMSVQIIYLPRFPAYIYSVTMEENDVLRVLSQGYQIWLVAIIWIHSYCTEVIMIVAAGSITHCLENLSYKGSVVMANRQCDVPNLNEVLIKNWAAFEGKSKGSSAIGGGQSEKTGSALAESRKESGHGQQLSKTGYNQETYYLAHVVQNVVDIQYALDRYKDVEGVVDNINNTFGRMLFNHMSVYMSLMCTLFYTPIRYGSIIPFEGSILFSIVAIFYLVRLFIFFPSMGRINVLSTKFTESWMEGLRHIPKGKYAYEFYMHKLESCRKLAFDAGGFYLMQKGTVLTFVSIVTTHIIVLLQLY